MPRVYGNVKDIHEVANLIRRYIGKGYFISITNEHAFLEFFLPDRKKVELTFSGMTTGRDLVRSEYLARRELEHLLAALMPLNRLALEVSLATGLRISDVLSIRTQQVRETKDYRLRIREQKTGKYRRVYVGQDLAERMLQSAGKIFVFENRLDVKKHRTRQAVFKDLRRIAAMFRIKEHVSPHSCRKVFAVDFYHRCGENLSRVQKLLNHENEAVTMLYALADVLYKRTYRRKDKNKCSD